MSEDKKEEPPIGEDASETEELRTLEVLSAAPGEGVSRQVEMPSTTEAILEDEAPIPADEATEVEVKSEAYDAAPSAETPVEATPAVAAPLDEILTDDMAKAVEQEPEVEKTETPEPSTDEAANPPETPAVKVESEADAAHPEPAETPLEISSDEVMPTIAAEQQPEAERTETLEPPTGKVPKPEEDIPVAAGEPKAVKNETAQPPIDEAENPPEAVDVKSKANAARVEPADTPVEATPPEVASMNETATEELPTAAKQEPEAEMTETPEPPTDEAPKLTKETPAEPELEITETKESTTLESVDPPKVSPSAPAAASVKSKAVIALNINSAEGSMMYEKDGDWELEPDTMFPNSSATRGGNAGVNATFDGSGASTMYENETWVLEPDPNNVTENGPVTSKPLASLPLSSEPLAFEAASTMYENESWVLEPDPNEATGNRPSTPKPLASTPLTSEPLAFEAASTMYENESWILEPDPATGNGPVTPKPLASLLLTSEPLAFEALSAMYEKEGEWNQWILEPDPNETAEKEVLKDAVQVAELVPSDAAEVSVPLEAAQIPESADQNEASALYEKDEGWELERDPDETTDPNIKKAKAAKIGSANIPEDNANTESLKEGTIKDETCGSNEVYHCTTDVVENDLELLWSWLAHLVTTVVEIVDDFETNGNNG